MSATGGSVAERQSLPPMPRIDWLDYVRLFCAILVMLDHYLVIGPNPAITPGVSGFGPLTEVVRFGILGVCVFMMISGMMITFVALRQSASVFTIGRFARIYPTFVLCMIITAMLSPLGPPRFYDSWGQMLANLFVYAPAFGYRYVDTVYWTLVIEVHFYVLMMLVIATGGMRHLQSIVVVWLGLQVISLFIGPQLPLIGRDYYFISAGVVMALLYERRNERLNLVLLAISLLLCLQTSTVYAHAWGYDAGIAGVLTTGIFAILLLMRGRTLHLPFARRIGSMSYALYLLHFSLGMTMFHWWMTDANKWALMLGTCALFILLAFAMDDVMSFRLRATWRRIAAATVARPLIWWEGRQVRSRAS
jgi:peptidoglycan/LPS O-acetylase OafA/YrhL